MEENNLLLGIGTRCEELIADIGDKNEGRFRRIEGRQLMHCKRIEKVIAEFEKVIKAHEKFLREICRKQEVLDETLGNVLLAIRQNEYLQAWYPAQSGFTAGNIVGIHPAKLEKQKKE